LVVFQIPKEDYITLFKVVCGLGKGGGVPETKLFRRKSCVVRSSKYTSASSIRRIAPHRRATFIHFFKPSSTTYGSVPMSLHESDSSGRSVNSATLSANANISSYQAQLDCLDLLTSCASFPHTWRTMEKYYLSFPFAFN
jgi:hypothetical protein